MGKAKRGSSQAADERGEGGGGLGGDKVRQGERMR